MSIQGLDAIGNRLRFYARRRRAERLRASALRQPFSGRGRKILLVTQPERIPQSQIFPFHHYADDLRRLYGAEVREADLYAIQRGDAPVARGADVVGFQTPFDISDADLHRLLNRLGEWNPGARMVCFDWFAPTDLRNAARMDPLVDLYVKKNILRDRAAYGRPTRGDTNLTDHYNRRFGLDAPEQRFDMPPGFMDKLVLGASFATAPNILPGLLGHRPQGPRPLDLHARFAVRGTPWYQAMRTEAEDALAPLSDLAVPRGEGLPLPRFMAEMTRSKLAFSPFGYGEVCWRDYESALAGTVLVKPDMSHVETMPDIFIPWETYAPVAWDLSDFDAVVRRLLADPPLRERLARQAFDALHGWLTSDAFARSMARVLG